MCGNMAPVEGGMFKLVESRGQPLRFVHKNCEINRFRVPPRAVPVRFLLACPNGHMYDVPWNDFVHDGHPCAEPRLHMTEFGVIGGTEDIWIQCKNCDAKKIPDQSL